MGKPKPPAPPDPQETSAAQTGTNVSTSIANSVVGAVDQNTPYGSLSYDQTGTHEWTDPFTGEQYSVPTWAATTTLSDAQQGILDSNNATSQNLADTAVERSGFLQDYLSGAGLDPNEIDNKLYEMGKKRIDPRMEQMREATHTRLANQGIAPGSEAYNREMSLVGQQENDAYNELSLRGRGQALSEVASMRNQPINEIIGLLSGTQIQNPNVQMSQPAQMPYVDNAGLINQNYAQQYGNYAQQVNSRNQLFGGILGLGAGALSGGMFL
jgi:hypothetical protein